ncbi:MAG TPA: hypothetical protein VN174_03370 [Candidatus Methanoperedens sp.]|nr:hypothetical protein [Candidatus Methanoperedens sp.]
MALICYNLHINSTPTLPKIRFSIGDYLTDFENIYQIFDKQTQKDYRGVDCEYFLYRPLNSTQKAASFSIPVDNIQKSGLRYLIHPQDVKEIYKYLKKPIDASTIFDFKTIKEILYLNDPNKTIYVLKQLCANKVTTGEKFSQNYQEIINKIVFHLSAEIAFVLKKSPESIEKKILSLL